MSEFLHNEGKKFGAEQAMHKIQDKRAESIIKCLFNLCLELERRIEKLEDKDIDKMFYGEHKCPSCGGPSSDFIPGPEGSGAQIFKCPKCYARFCIGVGIQRVRD